MREVFTSCKKTKMILVDGDWSSGAVVMDIFFFFNKGWDARLACDCSVALSRWRWEIWLTERRTVPSGVMGTHSVCSGCVC